MIQAPTDTASRTDAAIARDKAVFSAKPGTQLLQQVAP